MAERRCRAASASGWASRGPSSATPKLIVLDEPNAHLDGPGEAALTSTLARLKQAGATTVLITHRPQALQRADKVLVLEDGTVSRFGPRDTVLPALVRPARAA